jgi:flagellar assembly factor FliW
MIAHTLPREALVTFPSGLPGFESCRQFVLVQSEEFDPGVCLKGLDAPGPTFFTVDPRLLAPDYRHDLTAGDAARLGATATTQCVWLVIVSCAGEHPRVNMRAPLVINPETMRGIQIVPADSAWPVDMPWAELACSS